MHMRFRECSTGTCLVCILGKNHEEITTRPAAAKAVPQYNLCPVPCLFSLVCKANSSGPGSHCHQISLWSALGSCLMPCQSPGSNNFVLRCWKASPLQGMLMFWACLQQGMCQQGQPWRSGGPLWYNGQLLFKPAHLPTLHRMSNHC